MKRWILGIVVAGLAGLAAAGAAGYSRVLALPADGVLAIVNTQANAAWRPRVISVVCPGVATRTVTILRVAGPFEYPIAQNASSAQTYVYEFQGDYWSGLSNGVKIVVSPACTGIVEVVYE